VGEENLEVLHNTILLQFFDAYAQNNFSMIESAVQKKMVEIETHHIPQISSKCLFGCMNWGLELPIWNLEAQISLFGWSRNSSLETGQNSEPNPPWLCLDV
jgi:hypothetical protein